MRAKCCGLILFIFFMANPTYANAASDPVGHVFDTINQRLVYMETVAAYKYKNRLPLILEVRERVLIKRGLLYANKVGLGFRATQQYMAMMTLLSRSVQQKWMQLWRKEGFNFNLPQALDNTKIMSKLIEIDRRIFDAVKLAIDKLNTPGLSNAIQKAALRHLTTQFVDKDQKIRVAQAIMNIQLSDNEQAK